MKAALFTQYGPPEVLKLAEIEKPTPKPNELLIKIHAASVTAGDIRVRASDFPPLFWLPARLIFGLFKPKKKILGHEFSGVVEEVGSDISGFKSGDEVFGTTTMLNSGSYAEYICIPEKWKHGVVGLKPKTLSHQQSAVIPIGAMTALFLLEKAKIKKGDQVLIYGASGSVGTYAVQIANYFGASVIGVCSTKNLDMVKSLGASKVIDYKKEDYTLLPADFDIVFDAVGKTSKSQAKRILKKSGVFVSVNMITSEKADKLEEVKDLADEGHIIPFIDKVYSLNEVVEAHEYVDQGHKRGNVVITIEP